LYYDYWSTPNTTTVYASTTTVTPLTLSLYTESVSPPGGNYNVTIGSTNQTVDVTFEFQLTITKSFEFPCTGSIQTIIYGGANPLSSNASAYITLNSISIGSYSNILFASPLNSNSILSQPSNNANIINGNIAGLTGNANYVVTAGDVLTIRFTVNTVNALAVIPFQNPDYYSYCSISSPVLVTGATGSQGAQGATGATGAQGAIGVIDPNTLTIFSEFGISLTNIGSTWTTRNTSAAYTWQSVAMSSSGQYQTSLVNDGNIWTSNDYGNTWTENTTISSIQDWYFVSISASGQYQTAVVRNGDIYISSDYGTIWTISSAGQKNWIAVSVSASGKYQTALGNSGECFISSDYGNSWNSPSLSPPSNYGWTGVSISASGQYQYIAGGREGTDRVYLSIDYGSTWNIAISETNISTFGISCSANGQYVFLAGSNGYLFVSQDFGTNWNVTNTSAGAEDWRYVSVSASGQYQFVAATNGYLYISSDYGNTWNRITSLGIKNWLGVAISASGQYLTAVVNNGYIYTSSTSLAGGATGTGYWSATTGGIYYNAGDVTIGTTGPFTIGSNPNIYATLGVSGPISTNAYLNVTNDTSAAYTNLLTTPVNQGTYIAWNQTVNGETDFINSKGLGSGGWYFYNLSTQGTTAGNTAAVMTIDGSGSVRTNGYLSATTYDTSNEPLPNIYTSYTYPGSYMTWNETLNTGTGSGVTGSGETDFINCYAPLSGQIGGWNFYNVSNIQQGGYANAVVSIDGSGNVAATSYTSTSDYRIKEEVKPLALEEYSVDSLNPVSYKYKDSQKESIGLIAHEVQPYYPFLVEGEKDGNKTQSVNYIGLIGVLIKEIQEIKKELKEIKKNIH
jgi:photosystem II stability/assembly factor-like uncharacterized protein